MEHEAKAPTCTEIGWAAYQTCSRCDYTTYAELPALEHDFRDGVCTRCGAPDPDYVPPIDRAALQAAIAAADMLDLSKYTDDSVAAFNKALADAKAALEADTQAAVDKAKDDLDAAVKALVEKPVFRFDDVQDASQYYYEPVYWAVEKGITTGSTPTTFNPGAGCTRAQVVTFLWRAAGKPEPTSTTNPFEDVAADQYYYKAVLWAVEKGITTGTSATTFRPDQTCTRGQIVTFLWRYSGQPEPESSTNPFVDVPADQYYYKPVLWAVENGITKGTSADKFSPASTCTRAQIVTFLYRAMVK
ncbi:MAG: S-layer homology domain-containing protein [Oscillospiraceae bacterium]|nr:S-layer homology domain-containing protein [Oscillospiraceae bacterium]